MSIDLAEIYKVAISEPTDEFIAQRATAIEKFLVDDQFRTHMIEWVEFVHVPEISSISNSTHPGVAEIVKAIREVQPAFPIDPQAKLVDLRATTVAILLRYLKDSREAKAAYCLGLAAMIVAASRLRTAWPEAKYAALMNQLRIGAQSYIDECAIDMRERLAIPKPQIKGAELAALAASANASLQAIVDAIEKNMRADSEELQILWWVFAKRSRTLNSGFDDAQIGNAVLASAVELFKMALIPLTPAAKDFLHAVISQTDRISLTHLISHATVKVIGKVPFNSEKIKAVVRQRPTLFPLVWLCTRLVESDMSPWEAEYSKRTFLSPSTEKAPQEWAEYLISELVACSILDSEWDPVEQA